jgi:hypothetical protein
MVDRVPYYLEFADLIFLGPILAAVFFELSEPVARELGQQEMIVRSQHLLLVVS